MWFLATSLRMPSFTLCWSHFDSYSRCTSKWLQVCVCVCVFEWSCTRVLQGLNVLLRESKLMRASFWSIFQASPERPVEVAPLLLSNSVIMSGWWPQKWLRSGADVHVGPHCRQEIQKVCSEISTSHLELKHYKAFFSSNKNNVVRFRAHQCQDFDFISLTIIFLSMTMILFRHLR